MRLLDQRPKYNIRIAYPADYSGVLNFMLETFMKTEPLIVSLGRGLADKPDPVMIKLMQDDIKDGQTLLCEDFLTKEIVGAAVNVCSRWSDIEYYERMSKWCGSQPARDLLRFYSYYLRHSDPWRKFCVDGLFECAALAVHPCHQKQGIAKRLIEESWILARDLGYRLFRIDASSVFTGSIAKSYGWKSIWSIPYYRYGCETGEHIFHNIKEPHTIFEIFVDDLRYTDNYRPKSVKLKK